MRRFAPWAVFLLGGCFSPANPPCTFRCDPHGNVCPDDYECRSDGYCHLKGSTASCTLGVTDLSGGADFTATTDVMATPADGPDLLAPPDMTAPDMTSPDAAPDQGQLDMTSLPDLTKPKPDMTKPPPDMTKLPPDLTMSPADMTKLPPDLTMPPPDLAAPPPDLAVPDLAVPDLVTSPPDLVPFKG